MRLMAVILTIFATSAAAYVSEEGHEYSVSCSKDGTVLTSKAEVTRQVGYGARRDYWRGKETLYLGRQCDALNHLYGQGTWSWANGGFWVQFQGKVYAFPGQELYCPGGEDLPSGLHCQD